MSSGGDTDEEVRHLFHPVQGNGTGHKKSKLSMMSFFKTGKSVNSADEASSDDEAGSANAGKSDADKVAHLATRVQNKNTDCIL